MTMRRRSTSVCSAFSPTERGPKAVGIAMDLICLVWWPAKAAFVFDEEGLRRSWPRCFRPAATPSKCSANAERRSRPFSQLPDGRWVPSPEFCRLTDGNPGHLTRLDDQAGR
jgi:hypothetical protein